jgi:hypothetical protein
MAFKKGHEVTLRHGHTRGGTRSREYETWVTMNQRCHNRGSAGWKRYGAKGVFVCRRWRESFEAFFEDMGRRPPGTYPGGRALYSIERIDNARGYECGKCNECIARGMPPNCRWATKPEQQHNLRTNRWIEAFGRRLILEDWARETGISPETLSNRIRAGWSIEKAMTAKVRGR